MNLTSRIVFRSLLIIIDSFLEILRFVTEHNRLQSHPHQQKISSITIFDIIRASNYDLCKLDKKNSFEMYENWIRTVDSINIWLSKIIWNYHHKSKKRKLIEFRNQMMTVLIIIFDHHHQRIPKITTILCASVFLTTQNLTRDAHA